MVAGKRALALGGLGRRVEADSAALRSLALWDRNDDAAFALGASALTSGRLAVAERIFAELVLRHPEDATLRDLLARTRSARAGGAP
jgi:Flp pilus assembly protein TadD